MNIQAVARRTGIPAATLRKWEQRYRVPEPQRTAGHHRRYAERDIRRIEWLKARLAEGFRIGEAARLLTTEQGVSPVWNHLAERLEGSLVVLEPLEPRHEDRLYTAAADPEIWRWMPRHAAESRETFHDWMEDALARSRDGLDAAFAVLDARSGHEVGSTRYLTLRPEHRGLEIGFTWMARETWGRGHNVEAKLLLLEHAFERLGCMRVEFKTDARNERSRGALAALPARFEGIFRKHMLVRGGKLRDSAYYSVIDDEWPEVKAALSARVAALR